MKLLAIIFVAVILAGCVNMPDTGISPAPPATGDAEDFCVVAADCVAAQCCHATSAVNHQFAPDCTDVVCSLECVPNTLDCGQGSIECVDNQCVVVITDPISQPDSPFGV